MIDKHLYLLLSQIKGMAFYFFQDLVELYKECRRNRIAAASRASRSKPHDPVSPLMNTNDHQGSDCGLSESNTHRPLVDDAYQSSQSFTVDQADVQSATELQNLATFSATDLDMGTLCPSRSTTGSEYLNFGSDDNGRPMSTATRTSEPFPHLLEEPSSTGDSSQLYTPPAVRHRLSDGSARRNYYELDEDKDRVIPREILCYLKVVFDGEKLSKRKPFQLDWQDAASYGLVNIAAQKCLHDSPTTNKKKVWRTDGVCKLFKNYQQCSSKALESEDQWSEVLHLIIAEFVTIPGNEYAKFHLEITWTYAAVDDTAIEKQYSKKIADLIDARMRTNWRKKKFIPQRDLHAIMSQSVVEHLIAKDESLKGMQDPNHDDGQGFDKNQFTHDVASAHKHLLALCVYEDLPLICLWQMLYLGEKPVNFPLCDSDIPPAAEKIKFDSLLFRQYYFTAYQFPRPTDDKVHCIDLRDDDILPIEACGEVIPIGSGASKVVYEVQIQPGHHRFTAVGSHHSYRPRTCSH
jgi:hypothetical protein